MEKFDCPYEAHLTLREVSVPTGGEWSLPLAGWSVVQARKGTGYYLQPHLNQVLETGSVLLAAGGTKGRLRASQLGELSFCTFNVIPARLTGLIGMIEQDLLNVAASSKENAVQIFPPNSPVASAMAELQAGRNRNGLRSRLKLFQLFVETIGKNLEQIMSDEDTSNARKRLQLFLMQTPSSELLEMNLGELAQKTHCTERHLGRIFRELAGMSFSSKRTELRLERSRELLATSNSKIVDVALECGYKSLSLFNLMFTRRFGSSPGKWRQKNRGHGESAGNGKSEKILSRNNRVSILPVNAPSRPDQNGNNQRIKQPQSTTRLTKVGGRISICLNPELA